MSEPLSTSPPAGCGHPAPSPAKTWFGTRAGRRYGVEIGLVVVVKLAVLALLCVALIALRPHRATTPAAVVQQYYAPPAPAARHD